MHRPDGRPPARRGAWTSATVLGPKKVDDPQPVPERPDPVRSSRPTPYKGADPRPARSGLESGRHGSTRFDPPKPDPNVPVTFKVQETATGRVRVRQRRRPGGLRSHGRPSDVDLTRVSFQGKDLTQPRSRPAACSTLTLQRDKAPLRFRAGRLESLAAHNGVASIRGRVSGWLLEKVVATKHAGAVRRARRPSPRP